jgi:hypothetical protein
MRSIPLRSASLVLCALALAAAGGCGGDSGDGGGREDAEAARPSADPRGEADPNMDPFAASCEEFLNSPDLYSQGTVKLSRRVRLPGANDYQVLLRMRNAITDICDKSGRGDYRPASEAVRAVKSGKYKTAKG